MTGSPALDAHPSRRLAHPARRPEGAEFVDLVGGWRLDLDATRKAPIGSPGDYPQEQFGPNLLREATLLPGFNGL